MKIWQWSLLLSALSVSLTFADFLGLSSNRHSRHSNYGSRDSNDNNQQQSGGFLGNLLSGVAQAVRDSAKKKETVDQNTGRVIENQPGRHIGRYPSQGGGYNQGGNYPPYGQGYGNQAPPPPPPSPGEYLFF